MIKIFRYLVRKYLIFFAKRAIKKNSPFIIAITGSVGKTTTRKAVLEVVKTKYKKVLENYENYNTDFGICLSIFGQKTGFRSFLSWVKILIIIPFLKPDFDCIVMECAADKKGDISDILEIFKPNVGILTNISDVHVEKFGSKENIFEEKIKLIKASKFAIVNQDDEFAEKINHKNKLSFGFSEKADVFVKNAKSSEKGISGEIFYKKKLHKVSFDILGIHSFYSFLAAILVGEKTGISFAKSVKALCNFFPPEGRMNILEGIKSSKIIDSSYNSSPKSCIAALEVLKNFKGRKVAILGEMLELGSKSKEFHQEVGIKAASIANVIFAVGENAKYFLTEEFDNSCFFWFKNADSLSKKIRECIKEKDAVLIKGSAGVKLKKIVEILKKKQGK